MKSCGRILVALFAATKCLAAPQSDALRVEGTPATLAQDLADCRDRLHTAAAGDCDGEDRAHRVLGHLRLGEPEAARDLLDGTPSDADAAVWATIAHHWYRTASGDDGPIRAHLPRLQRALDGAAGVEPTFAAAALAVHARVLPRRVAAGR